MLPSYKVNIKLSTLERLILHGIKPSGKHLSGWQLSMFTSYEGNTSKCCFVVSHRVVYIHCLTLFYVSWNNRKSNENDFKLKSIRKITFCTSVQFHNDISLKTKLSDKKDDFNLPIVNFPFVCNNIPAASVNGVYSSLKWVDPIFQSLWFLSWSPW